MEILLKNIPSNGNSCVLYDCKDCGLSGAPLCQDMVDFLGKKKRETFEEQENTRELEALERLEKRIEELERIHCAPSPSPLITQPYQQIPEDPMCSVVVKLILIKQHSYQRQGMINYD